MTVSIFPLGTSRLHEPLESVREDVNFPRVGYFHSSSQMLDVLRLARGDVAMPLDVARFFFRKDQTPSNSFDLRLWSDPAPSFAHLAGCLASASGVVVEISSPKSYVYKGYHVQGNPNADRSVPYSEVWREGYYRAYEPQLDVDSFDDTSDIERNLEVMSRLLTGQGKKLLIVGHLVDPSDPHPVRMANNVSLQSAIKNIKDNYDIDYYDSSHLVSELGFRQLPDGTLDIHHLPEAGLPRVADEIMGHFQ